MNAKQIFLSSSEKIGLISNLSTMLSAGIPILEAVSSLLSDAKGNAKIILEELTADLTEGKRVNTTLAKFPRVFDNVTVNLVKAGEEAGTLADILKDLRVSIRKENEFSDKIKSALTYPVLIVVIFIGVLLMILVVVVPRISTVFSRLTVALPLPTRVMIAASNILLHQTLPLVTGMAIIGLVIFVVYRRNRGLILTPILSLPVISDLVRKIDLARFSHSMYLLLESGLPITTAMQLTEDLVVRTDMAKLISKARASVVSGQRLSEGFKSSKGLIPSVMIKLMEVGDRTGTLPKSMQDISEYMDYEVENSLKTITVLLEPIMLVFVGVAVGGMMLAIIAPIYGLIGQLGSR